MYARESTELSHTLDLPAEIFIALLEKMELSAGFLSLEKKTNKPHTSRTSLLPSREVVSLIASAKEGDAESVVSYIRDKNQIMIQKIEQQRINEENQQIANEMYHHVPHQMSVDHVGMGYNEHYGNDSIGYANEYGRTKSKERRSNNNETLNTYFSNRQPGPYQADILHYSQNAAEQNRKLSADESTLTVHLDQMQTDLQSVFEMYCSLGDPLNAQFLSLTKFIKMMISISESVANTQSGEFKMSLPDIELIFEKAKGYGNAEDNSQNVIGFSQFMFALELVAMKVYRYSPNAITQLIKDHVLPLREQISQEVTSSSEHIIQLMELLKDEEMVNLLEIIHRTLYPYYAYYAGEGGLMSLDHFVEFCEDFKIFPDILPDDTVVNFFKTLSNFY